MERELRRYQSILAASGLAVIAFGVWDLVKGVIILLFGNDNLRDLIEQLGLPWEVFAVTLVIILIIFFLFLLLRLFIGLSAYSESKGKKKGKAYLILAGILFVMSIISITTYFGSSYSSSYLDLIVALIVEATSAYAFFEMIYAGVKVKKIRKQLEERGT